MNDDDEYDGIVGAAVTASALTGPLILLPVPGPTEAAMAGVWATMMVAIARRNGHQLTWDSAKRIGIAVLAGAGTYHAGTRFFVWLIAKVPGIGMVAGASSNAMINVATTLWIAYGVIDLFRQPGPVDTEFCIKFLIDEIKPKMNARKLRRIWEFVRRNA